MILSSGIRAEVFLADSRQRRGDKRNQICTLCVRDSQHNATEETRGATFIQSGYRKENARNSCKNGGNGGNVEEGT
jgi:hypothetical protein